MSSFQIVSKDPPEGDANARTKKSRYRIVSYCDDFFDTLYFESKDLLESMIFDWELDYPIKDVREFTQRHGDSYTVQVRKNGRWVRLKS
jgi:hypothetical protein